MFSEKKKMGEKKNAFNSHFSVLKNTVNHTFILEYISIYNVIIETQANRMETVFFFDEKSILKESGKS